MLIKTLSLYTLILSTDPCYIFKYYKVDELHGLKLSECQAYSNSDKDAYIAGFCNLSPIDKKPFVFINISRCTDDIHTTGLVMHEMMHLASILWKEDLINHEEEMITFAEEQTYTVVEIIKIYKKKH